MLRIFHSDPDHKKGKREKGTKRRDREREGPMEVTVITPEKLNLGINHRISILLPTFLAVSVQRIGDSSCDAAITSLAGIKIQLYIKLSYIAPYLYLSRWYFLRFLPYPRAQRLPPFSLSSSWRRAATVITRYTHTGCSGSQRHVNDRWRFYCSLSWLFVFNINLPLKLSLCVVEHHNCVYCTNMQCYSLLICSARKILICFK